jgi:cation transport regulator ChaC
MPLIFQYGSTCDAARLKGPQRLNSHAESRGAACTVEDFDIQFDVYSHTNGCAAADLVSIPGLMVWGVLYEIPADFIRGRRTDGQKTLAQIEGEKYEERTIRVRDRDGTGSDAITFMVKQPEVRYGLWTSADYVGHIVQGLRDHDVPDEYIQHVITVAVQTNKNAVNKGAAAEESRRIESLRQPPRNA